jgi:hypothetical protein
MAAHTHHYKSAMLWKSLRNLCSRLILTADVAAATVLVMAPPLRQQD